VNWLKSTLKSGIEFLVNGYSRTIIFDWAGWPEDLPYGAICRLPTGKLAGILTYFRGKVNKNRCSILDA
jgi:hypothetical protein